MATYAIGAKNRFYENEFEYPKKVLGSESVIEYNALRQDIVNLDSSLTV